MRNHGQANSAASRATAAGGDGRFLTDFCSRTAPCPVAEWGLLCRPKIAFSLRISKRAHQRPTNLNF